MREETIGADRGGMWAWLLQRVTAVLLLLGLAVHIIVTHALGLGQLSFENVGIRLGSTVFIVLDLGLLAVGLFHGLNGLRGVLLDYGFSGGSRRAVSVVLGIIGVTAFAYGTWALWPWLTA